MAEKINTIVLGIGNTLLGDEGVGVCAIKRLEQINLPDCVLLVDGSTAGFKLFVLFEQYRGCKFIIIDALKAKSGHKKGELFLIPLADFYNIGQSNYHGDNFVSFHQTAVIDVLRLFYLTYGIKIEGHFIGINIFNPHNENIDFSMELSQEIEGSLDKIIKIVKKLIH